MKKGLPTVRLVDTRKTLDPNKPHLAPVPIDEPINNGQGALRYLGKKHPESGKPIFYWPKDWESFSPEKRANALDHSPVANDSAKRTAQELEAAFDVAGPQAQDALVERLFARLQAKSAAGKQAKAS